MWVVDVCGLAVNAGGSDCVAEPSTQWYYDRREGSCQAFKFSGCGGNGNRFSSKEECEKQCSITGKTLRHRVVTHHIRNVTLYSMT